MIIFYEKIFLGFLFGSTSGTPKQYSALKPEEKYVLVRGDLPVAIRCLMLRRKEDGKLKTVEKLSWTKRKITFLDALGTELFPWPLLEAVFIVKETLGAVFEVFWTSLGFAQSKYLCRSLVPGFYKASTMALPRETLSSPMSVLGTTTGNHLQSFATLVLFCFLRVSWTMGIFLRSAKAEFRIWKFLTKRCTNHVRDDKHQ